MTRPQRRALRALRSAHGCGALPRARPDRAVRARRALRRWGPTPASACTAAAITNPDGVALIDDRAAWTFAELDSRTTALACALRARGMRERDTLAVSCPNHGRLVEIVIACSKIGLNMIHVPADAPSRIVDARMRDAGADTLIADFHLAARPSMYSVLISRSGEPAPGDVRTLDDLRAAVVPVTLHPVAGTVPRSITFASPLEPSCPGHSLTGSLLPPGTLRSPVPSRSRGVALICAPLSMPWGHAQLMVAMRLRSTVVVHPHFDPVDVLAAVHRHRVETVVLLPGMLRAILNLPRETLAWYDTSSLRAIVLRDRDVPVELALPAMHRFGSVLYSRLGPSIVKLDRDHARALAGSA